jgi:NADH-quinone oxidoreductase subunit A
MDDVLSGDLIHLFAFCLGSLAFAVGPIVVVHLLAERKTRDYANKTKQYIECGMDPIGDAWIRYSAVYYLYSLSVGDRQLVRLKARCGDTARRDL